MMAQTVTPLPSIGDVVPGRDVAGRELRISGHPESDRVVLSIWQDGRCQATVRLARADVPEVTRALVAGLVPVPASSAQSTSDDFARPTGTVHRLHPDQRDHHELDLDRVHPDELRTGSTTSVGPALRQAADRFATTVIAGVRRFTSGR